MNIEIERRFLIDSNKIELDIFHIFNVPFKIFSAEEITQYYFKNNSAEISQRVRDEYFEASHKHQYTLNIKSNIDHISRYEFEKVINQDDFDFFSKNCCNKCLHKFRFIYLIGKDKWEINYLPEQHLLIAEIELKKKDKKLNIPFNFEKEVTDDKTYLAENLAIES